MTHTDMRPPPVEVTVKNWADAEARKPTVKKSTLHTYVIDPAGTNGPKNVQICEYEPRRVRTVIQVYENPIALTLDSPVKSPDVSGYAGPQPPVGRLLLANPHIAYEFMGPDALFINSVNDPTTSMPLPMETRIVETQSAVFAAAAAGSLFPPSAGEFLTGFVICFQAPGAAVNADITVTNVFNGVLTYRITIPTTGLIFQPALPKPIAPSSAAAFINVNVPAIVGGPGYSIYLQSMKPNLLSRVTVTKEYC